MHLDCNEEERQPCHAVLLRDTRHSTSIHHTTRVLGGSCWLDNLSLVQVSYIHNNLSCSSMAISARLRRILQRDCRRHEARVAVDSSVRSTSVAARAQCERTTGRAVWTHQSTRSVAARFTPTTSTSGARVCCSGCRRHCSLQLSGGVESEGVLGEGVTSELIGRSRAPGLHQPRSNCFSEQREEAVANKLKERQQAVDGGG